jgi:multidrug efflux pump subunit AcrB
MRFLLAYDPEKPNTSYIQFLVDVEDYRLIEGMVEQVEADLEEAHPDAMSYVRLFRLGPGSGGRIQAKFMGTDRHALREAATQARDILREDGGAKGIRMDWRQRVKVVVPTIADEEANIAGTTRPLPIAGLAGFSRGDR